MTILPCPFCGQPPITAGSGGDGPEAGVFLVCCPDSRCGCAQVVRTTQAEAVAAWNRRAPAQRGGSA
jgi:Lar family restriction alleviation protein